MKFQNGYWILAIPQYYPKNIPKFKQSVRKWLTDPRKSLKNPFIVRKSYKTPKVAAELLKYPKNCLKSQKWDHKIPENPSKIIWNLKMDIKSHGNKILEKNPNEIPKTAAGSKTINKRSQKRANKMRKDPKRSLKYPRHPKKLTTFQKYWLNPKTSLNIPKRSLENPTKIQFSKCN